MPWPSMVTSEPSPKRTRPVMFWSSSEKTSRQPVMWFVAPVSRYHLSAWRSPSELRWSWARGSSRWTSNRVGVLCFGEVEPPFSGLEQQSKVLCFGEATSPSSVLEQHNKVLCSGGAQTSTMSSAGPSSSSSARLARSLRGLRQSLAQWLYLPQLRHR